jgi:hypothetical protein
LFGITHPSNAHIGDSIFEVSVQRDEQADVANGTYSVTEVFTIVSGAPFWFSARTEAFEENENGIATITINGTIQGLGRTLSPSFGAEGGLGFDRACSGFVNHVKPQLPFDASGIYVKYKPDATPSGLQTSNPTTFSITQSKCRGTVDFSIAYSDNPALNLPSGIVSRTCAINTVEPVRVQVSHPIPFRRLGPIIQDIKTPTEGTMSIQCQAQATNTGNSLNDTNRVIDFIEDELNRLKGTHANPANFDTIRVTGLQQNFSDVDLTCSATLDLAFTLDLAQTPTVTGDITLRKLS